MFGGIALAFVPGIGTVELEPEGSHREAADSGRDEAG